MSGAIAGRSAQEKDKGRVEATKVKRYWPGKAPEWADADDAAEPSTRVKRWDADDPKRVLRNGELALSVPHSLITALM
jgi:hypothetical protein